MTERQAKGYLTVAILCILVLIGIWVNLKIAITVYLVLFAISGIYNVLKYIATHLDE